MEKTNLVSEFRTRVGEDNHEFISDQTFESIADAYLPRFANDADITDDTWKEPITVLKNFAGQAKASRMKFAQDFEVQNKEKQKKAIDDAVAAAKSEWEKTIGGGGKGEGGEQGGGKGEGGGNTDIAEAVKQALDDYNKKLFGEDGKSGLIGGQLSSTAEFIKTQTESQEQARLAAIGKELKDFLNAEKATKDPAINLAIKNMVKTIKKGENPDIDQLKLQTKAEYEKVYKEWYGDGGKPYGGSSAGGEGDEFDYEDDPEVKKFLEERSKAVKDQAEKLNQIKSGLK